MQRIFADAHDDFFAALEKEKANDASIPKFVYGEAQDFDENANSCQQGLTYRYTELYMTNFPYLSLFLCNIPGLNINFAPEVNHRKVDPSQYSQAREAGLGTDVAATTMFDVLDDKRDSLGLGSKQVLIYPFALYTLRRDRRNDVIVDPQSPKTMLRSVMQVPFQTREVKANSAVVEVSSHRCARSNENDFVRLQFMLNTSVFGETNCTRSWEEVLNTDYKLSSEQGILEFLDKIDLPRCLVERLNGNGKFAYSNCKTFVSIQID